MLVYVGKRIAAGLVTLIAVSIVVFAATEVLPGNAAYAVLGQSATPLRVHALELKLHLNESLIHQYLTWASGLVQGNFGTSLSTETTSSAGHAAGMSVWSFVKPAILNSAALIVTSGAIATAIGVSTGILAAVRKRGIGDNIMSTSMLVITSLPEFVVATVLIILFATTVTRLLPAVSPITPGSSPWSAGSALVLPVATLVLVTVPYIFRITRATMIEALGSEYVQMARLKGMPARRVLLAHALPNAAAPIVQVVGLTLLYLAGGIVIVEYVFQYPGIGQLLVTAVSDRDIPLVQCIVLFLAAFYIAVNISTDLIALWCTPRRRVPR